MSLVLDLASAVLLIAGSAFLLIGAVGLHRLPDLFTRLHAASLIDTTGAALILLGLALAAGLSLNAAKLIFLLLFLLFLGPVATHAIANAALHAGVQPMAARPPAEGGEAADGEGSPSKP